MHPALAAIRDAIRGTPYQGDVFLVGGAVRDGFLGLAQRNDFDLVTRQSAPELAEFLWRVHVGDFPPVTYPRFGTAMVQVRGVSIELVTARKESYRDDSRKPDVEPATYLEDALRRDFTVNTLRQDLETEEVLDTLGTGIADLERHVLCTPLDPVATFHDDPLRMLRAVRFRWQLGFTPAPGLYEAVRETRDRLQIISFERIRDELLRMLGAQSAPSALQDLMDLGLFETIAPEFEAMVGVEQGDFHHLDVWSHTLLVIQNLWSVGPRRHSDPPGNVPSPPIPPSQDLILAALLHDVGKPATRTVDAEGRTRFFGHESLGAELSRKILRRWKLAERDIDPVVLLVKNHMRLGSSPTFTKSAARRLLRDLGDQLNNLMWLVEADASSLRPGVRRINLAPVWTQLDAVQRETPREVLESPLTGQEIMALLGLEQGPEVGKWKSFLTEKVLDGELAPGDKTAAEELLRRG